MFGEFHPSVHLDNIYNLMADYDENFDHYNKDAIFAIIDYFTKYNMNYQLACSPWPDECGGVCSVAFIDNSYPQLVVFDYVEY